MIGTPTTRTTIPSPLKNRDVSTLIATIDSAKPVTRYVRPPGTERHRAMYDASQDGVSSPRFRESFMAPPGSIVMVMGPT